MLRPVYRAEFLLNGAGLTDAALGAPPLLDAARGGDHQFLLAYWQAIARDIVAEARARVCPRLQSNPAVLIPSRAANPMCRQASP